MRFRYQAVDGQNRKRRGFINAPSRSEAFEQLQREQLRATTLDPKPIQLKLGAQQKQWMLTHLCGLINSGIPLDQALETALPPGVPMDLREDLLRDLRSGVPLAELLQPWYAPHPDILALLRAGEQGGKLAQVLQAAAELLRQQQTLKGALVKALFYPTVVLALLLVVMVLVLMVLIPQLMRSFADLNLPLASLRRSAGVLKALLVLIALGTGALVMALRLPSFHLPPFSTVLKQQRQSFFLQALAALLSQGIPLHQAVPVLMPLLQVSATQQQFAVQSLEKGYAVSEVLRVLAWPPAVLQGIRLGEGSGRLTEQVGAMGGWLNQEAQAQSLRWLAWLEPGMLIFLAAVVGLVIWGIFTPIMGIYSQFSGV